MTFRAARIVSVSVAALVASAGTGGVLAAGCTPTDGTAVEADAGGAAGTPGAGGARTAGTGGATGSGGAAAGGTGGGEPGSGGTTAAGTGGAAAGSGGAPGTGGAAATGGARGTGGATAAGGAGGGGAGGGPGGPTDACGRPSAVTVPAGYTTLVWQDEFDVDGRPSSANWGYEQGFVRNEEDQWYQPDNAQVSGGRLVITARRETRPNPNYQAGSSDWKRNRQNAGYTSSSLTTSGKQSWQFGRFEMCAQIPISAGMWPAWWTLGVSGEWPSNGEVDIMEFYQGKILANVACGTTTRYQAKWDSVTRAVNAAWAATYHLWRMDWNSTEINLYVDDSLMNNTRLEDMLNPDGRSPFLQRAYMIVNLAIGGLNGGDPGGTSFPQTYSVDYIRVFQ
jgi:beta-glucanase (GH16 family)